MKLLPEASRQLLRDIENNPKLSCAEILRLRPKYYLGKYKKAAQNRHSYLITLKRGPKAASYIALKEKFGIEDELAKLDRENSSALIGAVIDVVANPKT